MSYSSFCFFILFLDVVWHWIHVGDACWGRGLFFLLCGSGVHWHGSMYFFDWWMGLCIFFWVGWWVYVFFDSAGVWAYVFFWLVGSWAYVFFFTWCMGLCIFSGLVDGSTFLSLCVSPGFFGFLFNRKLFFTLLTTNYIWSKIILSMYVKHCRQ